MEELEVRPRCRHRWVLFRTAIALGFITIVLFVGSMAAEGRPPPTSNILRLLLKVSDSVGLLAIVNTWLCWNGYLGMWQARRSPKVESSLDDLVAMVILVPLGLYSGLLVLVSLGSTLRFH